MKRRPVRPPSLVVACAALSVNAVVGVVAAVIEPGAGWRVFRLLLSMLWAVLAVRCLGLSRAAHVAALASAGIMAILSIALSALEVGLNLVVFVALLSPKAFAATSRTGSSR